MKTTLWRNRKENRKNKIKEKKIKKDREKGVKENSSKESQRKRERAYKLAEWRKEQNKSKV